MIYYDGSCIEGSGNSRSSLDVAIDNFRAHHGRNPTGRELSAMM